MDRQPLSRTRGFGAGQRRPVLALLALGLAGCQTLDIGPPAFDGPTTADVLVPGDGGPFEEPIAFVANQRSGRIVPVDLKHATLLADQYGAPWLAPRGIATGDERQLGQVVVWSPSEGAVSVLAVDLSHGVLVEAPYLVATDGEPVVFEPTSTEPEFQDNDGSGDSASLAELELRTGWATTEDWSLEYDGAQWWVYGSRSGKQASTARTGERFITDNGEIAFTIDGTASAGDHLRFSVDTGIVEHDLGGMPLAVTRLDGTSVALVAVWEPTTEQGSVVAWDLDTQVELGRVEVGEGLQPWRIEQGAQDGAAWEIFVADSQEPLVHVLQADVDSGALQLVDVIETAAPVSGLAWLAATEPDGTTYDHLFVAPAGLNRVDLYDLAADAWVDVNPLDETDVAGIELYTPVMGLDAAEDLIELQTLTAWGVRDEGHVVALTTFDGSLLLMDAATGCLVTDIEGPQVSSSSGEEDVDFTDLGASSTPALLIDSDTGRRVTTNPCGGLVRSETWTLTYDGAQGDWMVSGSLSGDQVNRAREDERYLSDNGGFSLLILSGPEASTDGDEFRFATEEGILRMDAIEGGAASDTTFEAPGEPVVFTYDAGPTGGGWDQLDRRSYVLLPLTGNDLVLRVRLETWNVEVVWD